MGPWAHQFKDGQVIRSTSFEDNYTGIVTTARTHESGYVCLAAIKHSDGWRAHPRACTSGHDLVIVEGDEADAVHADFMRALLLGEVKWADD